MFGYDPEVPAGYQDADIEMRELAAYADEVGREARRNLIEKLNREPTDRERDAEVERLHSEQAAIEDALLGD